MRYNYMDAISMFMETFKKSDEARDIKIMFEELKAAINEEMDLQSDIADLYETRNAECIYEDLARNEEMRQKTLEDYIYLMLLYINKSQGYLYLDLKEYFTDTEISMIRSHCYKIDFRIDDDR